jgi:hypothetical protein
MPLGKVTKIFEIDEGSTENMWYRIAVYFKGKQVEMFLEETMGEAINKLRAAGYEGR